MPKKDDKTQENPNPESIKKQLTNEYILSKSEEYETQKVRD